MVRFLLAIIFLLTLTVAPVSAMQQSRSAYGPVVSAYLTGLAEEFRELDFQLRQREISQSYYERARQRLTILRRFVQLHAAQSHEDSVPELQVLTASELGTLGLSTKPKPGALRVGAVLEERWKLIGSESRGWQFFVFERVNQREAAAGQPPTRDYSARAVPNPRDVIETVIIYEELPPAPAVSAPTASPIKSEREMVVSEMRETKPLAPEVSGPRVFSFYIPVYTNEARARRIEGEVVLSALFQRDGKVKDVVVEQGLGYGLNECAIDAVKRTRFEPARINGQPVDVRAQLVFTFKLDRVMVQMRPPKRGEVRKGNVR
jgi:TonB family protein